MSIELHLNKTESDETWGFRLVGGVDYDVPLTVTKVTEGSLADLAGLQIGDIVVRLDNAAAAELSHLDAHDLIRKAGNDLTLAVRRDFYEDLMENSTNFIRTENSANQQTEEVNMELTSINTVTETLEESKLELIEENKKWSTFLQKPQNPKPILKKQLEEISGENPEYKVIITKQKRKSHFPKPEPEIDETVAQIEEEIQSVVAEEIAQDLHGDFEYEVELHEEVTEEIEIEERELSSERDISEIISYMEESNDEESLISVSTTLSKDDKLLQVQKQLEALSKLPSAIQESLDVITRELSKIVGVSSAEESLKIEESHEEMTTITEEDTEKISDDENPDVEPQLEDVETESEIPSSLYTLPETGEEIPEEKEAEEEIVEEVEDEATKLENLRKAKLEKELQDSQKSLSPRPIERPIILPGGRRWNRPDDACPAVRHPSMSDDKIANTIESYSEVIVNHLNQVWPWADEQKPIHRINFMKYQPPPKNMDYLKNSEVLRMLRETERPVKGICSRAPKILAESDYYEQARASTPCN